MLEESTDDVYDCSDIHHEVEKMQNLLQIRCSMTERTLRNSPFQTLLSQLKKFLCISSFLSKSIFLQFFSICFFFVAAPWKQSVVTSGLCSCARDYVLLFTHLWQKKPPLFFFITAFWGENVQKRI